MGCGLRFKLEDFSPAQQERIKAQLTPKKKVAVVSAVKNPAKNTANSVTNPTTPLSLAPYSPKNIKSPPIRNLRDDKMTSTERRFNEEILHGLGRFEAITLKLLGGSRYTADWFFMDGDTPVLVETKGGYRLQSEGRAHTAFLEAASQFPLFRFVWAKQLGKGKGWDMKYVIPAISENQPTTSKLTD